MPKVTITIELADTEAWQLAQFLKRTTWEDWRRHARSDDEAALMRDGCERLERALAREGYQPR